MEEVPKRYIEVIAHADQVPQLQALAPVYQRQLLGQQLFLFEDRSAAQLESLGQLKTPSLADLFVAKMGDTVSE
jgi:ABC-2 type transport system ATP-binding protein